MVYALVEEKIWISWWVDSRRRKGVEPFFPLELKKMRQLWKGRSSLRPKKEPFVVAWIGVEEAQRTMLTEDTKDAILVIEAINEEQAKRAQTAIMQELKDSQN